MKKLFVSVFALTAISLSVAAQDTTKTKKQDIREMKAAYKDGKQHHKEKMAELNLTEDQKKEMMANRDEFRTKASAIKNDKNLSEAERNRKMEALHKEQKEKRQALLTPEQKEKVAQQKQQHKEEAKDKAEKRMGELKTQLSLSDDQVTKWKELEKSNHAKMKAIDSDPSLDAKAKEQKREELRTHTTAQRKTILTPEQDKKFEEMKKDKDMPRHRPKKVA